MQLTSQFFLSRLCTTIATLNHHMNWLHDDVLHTSWLQLRTMNLNGEIPMLGLQALGVGLSQITISFTRSFLDGQWEKPCRKW